MDQTISSFLQDLQDAEMILIGVGEEFEDRRTLRLYSGYSEGLELLKTSEAAWMIPAWNRMYAGENKRVRTVLERLAGRLTDRNYFVIATATNDVIREIPWREGRLVMPCGGSSQKQCVCGCEHGLSGVTAEDWRTLEGYRDRLCALGQRAETNEWNLGTCPDCGKPLILNNIYSEKYDENGYLKQWSVYMKWLQGTLNRKLLILELGVGMQCPSVIRWPFEKMAFYNQKARFYRVNQNLYQLSDKISEKGIAISKNAIDWLEEL